MADASAPQYGPFDTRRSETSREREVRREAQRQAQTPEGKLQAQVVQLKAELAALNAYVMGFKGDGSGVEFKGNTVSFRLPERKKDADSDRDYEEVELTFCAEDDTQHTATFFVKRGSINPPL